jgi:hypothetical protein
MIARALLMTASNCALVEGASSFALGLDMAAIVLNNKYLDWETLDSVDMLHERTRALQVQRLLDGASICPQ